MRSLRALTWLLVLLVLVPAGVLGWLGYRSAAAFDDAVDARIRADLTEAATAIQAAAREEADALEVRLRVRFEQLAEALGRSAPAHGLPAAMAVLRAGLPNEVTVWDVRLLDAAGRIRWPITLKQDEPASNQEIDLLLFDLRRQADRLRFGRGDVEAAFGVWRDAAKRSGAPRLRAVARSEAALLEARVGRVDASDAHASLLASFGPTEREAASRPLTLLLAQAARMKDREAACALAEAWARGDLLAVPLTAAEREGVKLALRSCRQPFAMLPFPAGVGNPHLSASWPPPGSGFQAGGRVLVEGPAGSTVVATVDPDSLWKALEPRLESRSWDRIHVHVVPWAERGEERDGEWLSEVLLPGPFGVVGKAFYSHQDSAEAREMRVARRRVTQVGVLSLLALMVVGLVLVRRAVHREQGARQLRDDFIANVSHELRTPLTSVCLHAEMLAEEDPPADRRRELAHVVKAEGGRLAALVDDLLDFAALEQGVRRIEPEPVDLARAVREAAAPYEILAQREGVELTVDVPAGELVALADAHALSRILANLLSNAWRHGRPSRDGSPGRLGIRAYDDRQATEGPTVEVRDDGPGIPTAERGTVFERFHRGSQSTRVEGTGLGLALGRELARAMDGDLTHVAETDATVFRLTLPPVPDLEI